jgi:hypothetical protein
MYTSPRIETINEFCANCGLAIAKDEFGDDEYG